MINLALNQTVQIHNSLRPANLSDIDWIISHALEEFKLSAYASMNLDFGKCRQMLEKFIVEGQEEYLVLISHNESTPVGCIAAYAFEPIFSKDRVAIEVLFWVERESRSSKRGAELMNAYEYWAKLVGCKFVQYGLLSSSPERMADLYTRSGAYQTETVFQKVVK